MYHQPPGQPLGEQSSTYHQQPNITVSSYVQPTPHYVQPFYGVSGPGPMLAELPAPLPSAPPTSTSEQQLTKDEQLARKLSAPDDQLLADEELAKRLQELEVQEIRNRSNIDVSQAQRPVSMALPAAQWTHTLPQQRSSHSLRPHAQSIPMNASHSPGLSPQRSMQSLRPHSQSLSAVPWSPGSVGPPPGTQQRYSMLPEVVPTQTYHPFTRRIPSVATSDLPEVVASNAPRIVEPPSNPIALAAYLEEHRQVPYPPQWRLGQVLEKYHAHTSTTPKANWLDTPESCAWSTSRRSETPSSRSSAAFSFVFKKTGGSYRDPRFSWVMQMINADPKTKKSAWTYELRMDKKSGFRKTEVLYPGREKNILTTYVHASNYDCLRFVGPDLKSYLWASHMPMSSTNGSRYDASRHALFVATSNNTDPLFGEIVADHTYWDGFDGDNRTHAGVICMECSIKPIVGQRWTCKVCPDHNVCGVCYNTSARTSIEPTCRLSLTCLPDETLCIRSPVVDHALVVASLQVLKDWQKHELRRQKTRDPTGFMQSEDTARKQDLGKLSYWRGSDIDEKRGAPQRVRSRKESAEAMQTPNEISGALSNLMDAGLALAAKGQQGGYDGQHTGHHTYGGDGGGGGGDGGGGGGGGG